MTVVTFVHQCQSLQISVRSTVLGSALGESGCASAPCNRASMYVVRENIILYSQEWNKQEVICVDSWASDTYTECYIYTDMTSRTKRVTPATVICRTPTKSSHIMLLGIIYWSYTGVTITWIRESVTYRPCVHSSSLWSIFTEIELHFRMTIAWREDV